MSSREEEIRAGARAQQASSKTKDMVKQHSVGWDKYARDDTLTQQQLSALKNFDKKGPETQNNMLKDPATNTLIAEGLIQMLKTTYTNTDDLQYVLALIDDILETDRSRVQLFRDLQTVRPFQKLIDLLALHKDEIIVRLASHNVAVLIYPGLGYGEPVLDQPLHDLVTFVRDSLDLDELKKAGKKEVEKMIDMASCLMVFLRESRCRKEVNEQFHLHRHLDLFLDHAVAVGNVQLLYQIGFCLWLLSFDEGIAQEMAETNVVVNMLKVMKTVSKEKVIRVCLACLRNLVDKGTHNQTMIDNDAMKQLAVLRNRKWSDEEVREDLDYISDCLAKSVHVLSSLDMYRKEVNTGKLEWTPVHKSETFWRDNVAKICPLGGSVADSPDLQALIELLNAKINKVNGDTGLDSEEATTVAVICHDLGEFSRFHPQGKRILQSDAATNPSKGSTKDLLMSVMSSPPGGDEEIGKQALTCIHKMMVTNWQFLEGR